MYILDYRVFIVFVLYSTIYHSYQTPLFNFVWLCKSFLKGQKRTKRRDSSLIHLQIHYLLITLICSKIIYQTYQLFCLWRHRFLSKVEQSRNLRVNSVIQNMLIIGSGFRKQNQSAFQTKRKKFFFSFSFPLFSKADQYAKLSSS